MKIETIATSSIDVPAEAKKVSADAARALADSFQQIGQRTPIEVISSGSDRYRLVFGAKRLGAAILLGCDISAIVRQPDDFADEAEIRLTSISENFFRHSLTALERSVDVADWCTIWRAAHPTRPGRKPAKNAADELSDNLSLNADDVERLEIADSFTGGISEAAQRFLNINRREVFRALKIATIPADLRERIGLDSGLGDNQAALLSIAAEPYERATRLVELIIDGQASTIADAIAILDQLPRINPPAAWEKVNDRFARLKPTEQDAFFALNEAAVMRWIAERKAARR